jgi:heme oxygenase
MKREENSSVMQLLRESTRDLHDAAEHHDFQRAFAQGSLPKDRYLSYLSQMYLVHSALEERLRDAAESSAAIRAVVDNRQYQLPYLDEDLEFFGVDPQTIEPLPATRRLVDEIAKMTAEPASLLGLHYVLEGSNNGSRFIARGLMAAYELAPGPGLRYLDPYGDEQRERWRAFREAMDEVDFSLEDADRLVESARHMFQSLVGISDDLLAEAVA